MKKQLAKILLALLLICPVIGNSHEPNQSFIYVKVYEETGIEGRFELNVNQLNQALNLNLAKFPQPEDIRPYEKRIQEYILENASFSSESGPHKILFTGEITTLGLYYGAYVQFHFRLDNSKNLPDEMEVTYSAFIEENPDHRNFLTVEYNWKAGMINNEAVFALDFTEDNVTKTWDLTDRSIWKGFVAMVKQGIWHIWIGLDHILFLVAIILPSVVRRREDDQSVSDPNASSKFDIFGWEPVENFKSAFWYIVKIVTFFTIAHTITLSLASLQIVVLPSRIVETVIAFSIGLAAFHNIRPIFKGRDWVIAFVFGLFHGFGFASVLGDLGFKGEHLTLTLLGFNIGVEIGQLVIIAAIFPILYLFRKSRQYPKFLVGMSVILILMSLNWVLERGFEIDSGLDHFIREQRFQLAKWLGIR